jgi:GntR family transcriptional regulator, transcriptional repressor for pyruvate dehydrogenase complex
MAQPIERRKVYELVAERLIARLGDGLHPGDPLPPERELMHQYAVGRSSVREALRMLESRGLIASQGNGAFAVAEPRNPFADGLGMLLADGQTDLQQLFEVRRLLEGEIAGLAAERRTDEQVERLRAAIVAMEQGLDAEETYIAADIDFHLILAEATGNRFVVHLMHAVRDQLRAAFGTVFHVPGSPARSVTDHGGIADAVAARDGARARELMNKHIGRVQAGYESRHEES